MLNATQAALAVACFEPYQMPMSDQVDFTWLHLPWTNRQLAVNYHMTGWLIRLAVYSSAMCDILIMELKMAPIDAVWLFSVLTDLPTTSWFPTTPHPPTLNKIIINACGIGYASKSYLKNGGQFC